MTNIRRTRQSAPPRLSRNAAYPRTHTVSESKPVARIQISPSSNGQPVAARAEAGYLVKSLFDSFDAAAGRLHATTSAISQRIKARESDEEVLGKSATMARIVPSLANHATRATA